MANATDLIERNVARHITGLATYTPPATLYLALLKPGSAAVETGLADDELTSGEATGYARAAITWEGGSGSPAQPQNQNSIVFTAGSNWPAVNRYAICASGTIGTDDVLFYGQLTQQRDLNSTDNITFGQGDITLDAD